jgi:predicted enzyme related to lactoylglutathione lyase
MATLRSQADLDHCSRWTSSRYDRPMKLTYVVKFVSNMEDAVHFYRDTVGLPLKSQSPGWSEFSTGSTVLALHPASERNPPGMVELGFCVDDLKAFHAAMAAKGVTFSMPPTDQEFGPLAQFLDSEGSACSVSQEQEAERPSNRTAKKRTVSETFGHAAGEVEGQVKRAIEYIDNNIVPRARRDGESVLRRLSDELNRWADHLHDKEHTK